MVQPEDSGRSLWGEPSQSQPPNRNNTARARNGGPGIGRIAGLVLFLFIVLIVYLLTGRPDEGAKAASVGLTPLQALLDRLLPTLMVSSLLGLLYGFFFVSGFNRAGRLFRSLSGFWFTGLLIASMAYLVMGWLIPYSAFDERLIIPALLLVLAVILGFFAPIMPIWPLNVPDGQLWSILNFSDHFVNYVGPGIHWIRPLDGFEPYDQAGIFVIEIDDDGFSSHDNFPFRVKAKISCNFNPLNAERERWSDLRTIARESLQKDIADQIGYIIQNELNNDVRDHIRTPGNRQTVIERISVDIRDAIEARAGMGIKLFGDSPINFTLLPTNRILSASEYLAAFEAITGGTRRDDLLKMLGSGASDSRVLSEVVALATRDGDINISFDAEGNTRFALTSGDDIEIGESFSETFIQAANAVMNPSRQDKASPSAIPDEPAKPSALPEQATLSPGKGWEEISVPESHAQEQPAMPTNQPPIRRDQPVIQEKPHLPEEDVIEVEPDNDGVYKPRKNPIIPDDIPDEF